LFAFPFFLSLSSFEVSFLLPSVFGAFVLFICGLSEWKTLAEKAMWKRSPRTKPHHLLPNAGPNPSHFSQFSMQLQLSSITTHTHTENPRETQAHKKCKAKVTAVPLSNSCFSLGNCRKIGLGKTGVGWVRLQMHVLAECTKSSAQHYLAQSVPFWYPLWGCFQKIIILLRSLKK